MAVASYLARRVLAAVPTLIVLSLLIFALLRLIPGDPALAHFGSKYPPEGALQLAREWMGVGRPWHIQYADWVSGMLRGDLGTSLQDGLPIAARLAQRWPATVELSTITVLLAVFVGTAVGIVSALKRGSAIDLMVSGFTFSGVAVPSYFLGLILLWFFGTIVHIFPAGGRIAADSDLQRITNFLIVDSVLTRNWPALLDVLRHLILPAVAGWWWPTAVTARMTRSCLLDVMNQDYIRSARAKGLRETVVVMRHALKNAFIPVLTVIGLDMASVLGGSVMVETIFAWPGIGRWLVEAYTMRDYTVVQSMTLMFAVWLVFVMLVVDLLVPLIDPRCRLD